MHGVWRTEDVTETRAIHDSNQLAQVTTSWFSEVSQLIFTPILFFVFMCEFMSHGEIIIKFMI